MILMVACHLLYKLTAAFILEHDEMPDQVKKPAFVKNPEQQYLNLRHLSRRKCLALDGPPGEYMNRSRSAVSVPILASSPSEIMSAGS